MNVMALGLLRHEDLQSGTVGAVGNKLVYVGSKTGRDGLGGAVFASADLSEKSGADRPAVQVGDPFMEKLLLEACLEAIHQDLVVGVQDMGAAGLSSSVGEMAYRAQKGVDLFIDRVPRRETGMTLLEVLLSEPQERMVLTAKPGREEELLAMLEHWELDAVIVGEVAEHSCFRVFEHGRVVGDMPVVALNEAPTYTRQGVENAEIRVKREAPLDVPVLQDLGAVLLKLLASPSIASKRLVFVQYDQQVMTNTVVLPGGGDAAVLRVKGTSKGVAASTDCNPRYCYLDPKQGAMLAVAEAARNVACVGATPLAITNNLNFGNPTRPDVYYQLEQAVEGFSEACLALGTPVTGGNVSLYNQYVSGGETVAIYPTPTVGMVGVLHDVSKRATLAFKRIGDIVLPLGDCTDELGASEYLFIEHDLELGQPPRLDFTREKAVQAAVVLLVQKGLCDTAHDVSEGGLAVALAEMVMGNGLGAHLELSSSIRADALLFGEGSSRILIAVRPETLAEVETELRAHGLPYSDLGRVGGESLKFRYPADVLEVSAERLSEVYEAPLREALA